MHQLSLHDNHWEWAKIFGIFLFALSFIPFFGKSRITTNPNYFKNCLRPFVSCLCWSFFFLLCSSCVGMKEGCKIRHWFDSKLFADLTGTKWTNENEQQNRAHSTKWRKKKSLKCESTKCQNTSSIINLNQSDW